MYVLFLDVGPLMVVQSYEEDDLKKKKVLLIRFEPMSKGSIKSSSTKPTWLVW